MLSKRDQHPIWMLSRSFWQGTGWYSATYWLTINKTILNRESQYLWFVPTRVWVLEQALCHNSRWTQIKQTCMIVCRDFNNIMWSYVMWHAIMPLGPNSMLPFGRSFRCFKILEGCLYPCISLLFTTGFSQSRCLTKWLPQHFPISLDKS